MKWDHEYYFTHEGVIDLTKVREECDKRRRGDSYKGPESSIIHFHKITQDCDPSLTDHEEYVPDGS
jgi:hypothetical protein